MVNIIFNNFILEQILKHPLIMKKLEIYKSFDENEEFTLLQTIRIPKNLNLLTNKLPQPCYEKKIKAKTSSFTEENKESLPDIKMIQNNLIQKKSGKKNEKEEENKKEDKSSVITTQNINNTEENKLNNEEINIQKKKRRLENDNRSLDNIKRNEIYRSNNNNIKVIKSENFDKNNIKGIIREKSPNEDSALLKKKREFMSLLPNIKNQQNNENK